MIYCLLEASRLNRWLCYSGRFMASLKSKSDRDLQGKVGPHGIDDMLRRLRGFYKVGFESKRKHRNPMPLELIKKES